MAITSPNLLVGLRLRRALRGLRERAYDAAPRELDLEGIVRVAASFPQQHIGGAGKRGAIGRLTAQRRLRRLIAPGLMRNATQRQARFFDGPALELERGGDRHERKRIGEPVADFEIRVIGGKALRRKLDRGDDLVVRGAGGGGGAPAGRRGADGNRQTRSRARPKARPRAPWPRVRRAPRPCRRDAWRCTPRSRRGLRACG